MSRIPPAKLDRARSRTDGLRREIGAAMRARWSPGRLLKSRGLFWGLLIWGVFVAVVSVAVVWSREQPNVAEGRVMNRTRIARADFRFADARATELARSNASARAPRVYVPVPGVLEELRASIESLPEAVFGETDPERVEAGLRQQFGLTPEALAELQKQVEDGHPSPAWIQRVHRLIDTLWRTPILERETFQLESTTLNREIELRLADPAEGKGFRSVTINTSAALNAESPKIRDNLRVAVSAAGFVGPLAEVVLTRLTTPVKATYAFDALATEASQKAAAADVEPVMVSYPVGEVIYRRGEVLTGEQLEKVRQAMRAESEAMDFWGRWGRRLPAVGLVTGVALAIAGYTVLFVPRVRRNPTRMLGIAALLGGAVIVGCWATATKPALLALTGLAPTVFVTAILAIAYDQRVALAYGCLHGLLMVVALDQTIGIFAVLVCGVGVAVWMLREVRDRDALIRLGVCEIFALSIGMFLASLLDLPPIRQAVYQAALDGLWAGLGGFVVSGLVLYILPTLERTFGMVTGMTLIELRDPKAPLLRQLQQRAPGTYNHSLNVASLGESAADAIGADGLLTYVGALYHDIGKMNKPDYFVENQSPGFNRHDRLSPAMSLLVIVGHVKDGLELAREFDLPRPLHHFIESHHGTTLVEYFYHRARRQAEAAMANRGEDDEVDAPSELEYRYPGPRPRTREAAILMICDAVESAARAMADPTPARIDATVRALANKRLMDGQFDECDLTLRELNTIVETVSKTLASIYHGRIQYPGGNVETPDEPSGSGGDEPGPARTAPISPPRTGIIAPPSARNRVGSGEQ
ncbi:MAG: HD family phosphohydrolase [Phycisphaerales bacterium]